jgi:hypothetical protein
LSVRLRMRRNGHLRASPGFKKKKIVDTSQKLV